MPTAPKIDGGYPSIFLLAGRFAQEGRKTDARLWMRTDHGVKFMSREERKEREEAPSAQEMLVSSLIKPFIRQAKSDSSPGGRTAGGGW